MVGWRQGGYKTLMNVTYYVAGSYLTSLERFVRQCIKETHFMRMVSHHTVLAGVGVGGSHLRTRRIATTFVSILPANW